MFQKLIVNKGAKDFAFVSPEEFDPAKSDTTVSSYGCERKLTDMQRLALVRLARTRGVLRPNLGSASRAYHDKVIDHYENPR